MSRLDRSERLCYKGFSGERRAPHAWRPGQHRQRCPQASLRGRLFPDIESRKRQKQIPVHASRRAAVRPGQRVRRVRFSRPKLPTSFAMTGPDELPAECPHALAPMWCGIAQHRAAAWRWHTSGALATCGLGESLLHPRKQQPGPLLGCPTIDSVL